MHEGASGLNEYGMEEVGKTVTSNQGTIIVNDN